MALTSAVMGSGVAGMQQKEAPPSQLEVHLKSLRGSSDNIRLASQRARSIADRLIGSEPQAIGGQSTGIGISNQIQPPLMAQLEGLMARTAGRDRCTACAVGTPGARVTAESEIRC